MGYGITDWAAVGAVYMGEVEQGFWFVVSAGCCVLALVMGLSRKLAYRKHRWFHF